MLGVAALATSAMDLLQSLTAKKVASSSKGASSLQSEPFSASLRTADGPSASPTATKGTLFTNFTPTTMSALLDAQSQTQVSATSKTRSDALKSLFNQLDGDGNGAISKAEFEDKLGAGGTNVANADKVFAKLDKDGDGNVSIDELGKALKGAGRPHHGGGGDPADTAGATTSTTANADGSTTTSITYADGSKVTSTSAVPASSTAAAARTSYNAIEQMISKQAQQISSAASSLSITA